MKHPCIVYNSRKKCYEQLLKQREYLYTINLQSLQAI